MTTGERVLVAVDGGQTATKALVATVEGKVLGAGRGGPSDHFHMQGGVEKNRLAIQGAIRNALAAANVAPERVVSVGLGLTGAPPGGPQNATVDEIVREVVSPEAVVVHPDYKTNLAGASGGAPGVVLIAGGGSIGYGITGDGREALAGGFGYLLGDEGSAFNIGLRAIAAACRAADRRDGPTALEAVVIEHFDLPDMRTIPRVVYRAGFSRERISLLAPKVVATADAGDGAAAAIITKAGEELARIGLGVLRQLFTPGEGVSVYLTGGVFTAGERLMAPFRATLREGWPTAEPREPRFPPAVGALIMAARAVGISTDEHWLRAVTLSLPHAPA